MRSSKETIKEGRIIFGIRLDTQLSGLDAVNAALRDAQPNLKAMTAPAMAAGARAIAERAESSVDVNHPRNLWRDGSERLTPKYEVVKVGEYYYRVQSAPGALGKVQFWAEFLRSWQKPQAYSLVFTLDRLLQRVGGSGNGRILWRAADDLAPDIAANFANMAEKAAKEIEKSMGGS